MRDGAKIPDKKVFCWLIKVNAIETLLRKSSRKCKELNIEESVGSRTIGIDKWLSYVMRRERFFT